MFAGSGRIFVWLIVISALGLWGCDGDSVTVESRNFGAEIQRQQSLEFTFSHALMPDSLLSTDWDTTQYLRFSPQVKGRYKWLSSHRLLFSPSTSFLPSTDYQVRLSETLLKGAKPGLRIDESEVQTFHTPYLRLDGRTSYWARARSNGAALELRIPLVPNENLVAENLSALTSVLVEGQQKRFELVGSGESIELAVIDPGDNPKNFDVEVRVAQGLRCLGSDYTTKEEMVLRIEAPSREKIQVAALSADEEGTSGSGSPTIVIYTSQAVVNQDLGSLIAVNPQVAFEARLTDVGIELSGDFPYATPIEVTVRGALKGLVGEAMGVDYIGAVQFGEPEAGISFSDGKAFYMPQSHSKHFAVKISNVPEVKVTVAKIYENNIQHFVRGGASWYDEDGTDYNNYAWLDYDNHGDVLSQKVVQTNTLPKYRGYRLLNLDFSDRLQFRGIYLVRVESTTEDWVRAARVLAISDLGIIAKQGQNEISVFVNSVRSSEPVPGVSVSLVSTNNQWVLKGETDEGGYVKFDDLRVKAAGFRIEMITAQKNSDYNVVLLSKTRVETSRFDVGGTVENEAGVQGFLYGDRNMYRPGEKINIAGIIRDQTWKSIANQQVKVRVVQPNGKEYRSSRHTTDALGAIGTEITLSNSALTGTYVAELYTANDILLNSLYIGVEEFLPDRMNVVLSSAKQDYVPGEVLDLRIQATNLYGPPAANRRYETTMDLTREVFAPKAFKEYDFTITSVNNAVLQSVKREGLTDAQGIANESVPLAKELSDQGKLRANIFVAVLDESGRPVNRLRSVSIWSQPYMLGLRRGDRYIGLGQVTRVPIVAVDSRGNGVQNVPAHVQVIRFEWQNVMQNDGGSYRFVSQKREIQVSESTISIGAGQSSVAFTPQISGEYEVRVRRPGALSYVASRYWAYGFGYTQATSFPVNREGEVEMSLDRDTYLPGQTANILFKTPFQGKLLVTVERNSVLDRYYIYTDKRSAMLSIPVREDYAPNVYVSALLFRGAESQDSPLTLASGFAPLRVERPGSKMSVTITASEAVRSGGRQQISVRTSTPGANLTLAVVDEGILQLRNFVTPDPYGYYYSKRALQVNSSTVYPFLFPEYGRRNSSVAGGDGREFGPRVNPFSANRANLVTYWSGNVKTDGQGNASFNVDVPTFSGRLRIMAVAHKETMFGSAEKFMTVADPLVLTPGLPRFLSPGDTTYVPVTLANTTGKSGQATVQVKTDGPVSLVTGGGQNVELRPMSESATTLAFVARGGTGVATVEIRATAFGETFTSKTELMVRSPVGLIKRAGSGMTDKAATVDFAAPVLSGTQRSTLFVGRSPIVQFSTHLQMLIDYPHGCLEQTISTAFPQLYLAELAKSQDQRLNTASAASNVQAAIRKVEAQQVYNGGFTYWQGQANEDWWISAYATHFLIEAANAGYEVNSSVRQRALLYLGARLVMTNISASQEGSEASASTKPAPQQGYMLSHYYTVYVLALAGRPDKPTMHAMKSRVKSSGAEQKVLLACAYMAQGDQRAFRAIIPSSFASTDSKSSTGGELRSPLRDQALMCNAIVDADPENVLLPSLIRSLSASLASGRYFNTQETSFALMAIGKYSKRNVSKGASAVVELGGKRIGTLDPEGQEKALTLSAGLNGQKVQILPSKGQVFYSWSIQGLSSDGKVKEEDAMLRVRRTYFTRDGKQISQLNVRQNELIVVRLSLASTDNATVENVVITDMLPAGLEIENPRIGAIADLQWVKDQAKPEYFDIRDDRINYYTTAGPQVQSFYYVARAVTKGVFSLGPVSADAMYNADYRSYHGAGLFRVR